MGGISKVLGFFQGKSLTTAERLEKALAKGRITNFQLKNLQSVENEALRESLAFSLAKFSKSGGERAQRTVGQIDDMVGKFNLCDDAFVSGEAQRILTTATSNPGVSKSELRQAINQAEHLLDSVNTANGHYLNLFSDINPTGYLHPLAKKLANSLANATSRLRNGKIKLNLLEFSYSEPYKALRLNGKVAKKKGFKDFQRFDSLSRYIARYQDNPKLVSHMYHNYYLPKVDAETAEFLKGIEANYGTKLFIYNPLTKSQKLFIQEEFKAFQRVGLTDFPPLMEINKFDPTLVTNGFYGYSIQNMKPELGRYVKLEDGRLLHTGTMRHEYIHQFDKNMKSRWLRFKTLSLNPRAKISPEEINEMRSAGLDYGQIAYAKTETADLVAVAGQLDATKYSEEFASRLVKLGLPKEVLKMEPISLDRFVYQAFSKTEDLKLLDEIKLVFGGKIPLELQMELIDNPKHISRVKNLLHLNCSTNAKKHIQENLTHYVKYIKPETYKNPEFVKLLDLQRGGGHPAYDLYDLQNILKSKPEVQKAFREWATVRPANGEDFLGHVFVGCDKHEKVAAAKRLLNIKINGEYPYQEQLYDIKNFIHELPPEKLAKACRYIEKAAQKGEYRNLYDYVKRYKKVCEFKSPASQNIFGKASGTPKALNI